MAQPTPVLSGNADSRRFAIGPVACLSSSRLDPQQLQQWGLRSGKDLLIRRHGRGAGDDGTGLRGS